MGKQLQSTQDVKGESAVAALLNQHFQALPPSGLSFSTAQLAGAPSFTQVVDCGFSAQDYADMWSAPGTVSLPRTGSQHPISQSASAGSMSAQLPLSSPSSALSSPERSAPGSMPGSVGLKMPAANSQPPLPEQYRLESAQAPPPTAAGLTRVPTPRVQTVAAPRGSSPQQCSTRSILPGYAVMGGGSPPPVQVGQVVSGMPQRQVSRSSMRSAGRTPRVSGGSMVLPQARAGARTQSVEIPGARTPSVDLSGRWPLESGVRSVEIPARSLSPQGPSRHAGISEAPSSVCVSARSPSQRTYESGVRSVELPTNIPSQRTYASVVRSVELPASTPSRRPYGSGVGSVELPANTPSQRTYASGVGSVEMPANTPSRRTYGPGVGSVELPASTPSRRTYESAVRSVEMSANTPSRRTYDSGVRSVEVPGSTPRRRTYESGVRSVELPARLQSCQLQVGYVQHVQVAEKMIEVPPWPQPVKDVPARISLRSHVVQVPSLQARTAEVASRRPLVACPVLLARTDSPMAYRSDTMRQRSNSPMAYRCDSPMAHRSKSPMGYRNDNPIVFRRETAPVHSPLTGACSSRLDANIIDVGRSARGSSLCFETQTGPSRTTQGSSLCFESTSPNHVGVAATPRQSELYFECSSAFGGSMQGAVASGSPLVASGAAPIGTAIAKACVPVDGSVGFAVRGFSGAPPPKCMGAVSAPPALSYVSDVPAAYSGYAGGGLDTDPECSNAIERPYIGSVSGLPPALSSYDRPFAGSAGGVPPALSSYVERSISGMPPALGYTRDAQGVRPGPSRNGICQAVSAVTPLGGMSPVVGHTGGYSAYSDNAIDVSIDTPLGCSVSGVPPAGNCTDDMSGGCFNYAERGPGGGKLVAIF